MRAAEAGQEERAGTWLRRAAGLARRENDGKVLAAALVELGAMHERRPADAAIAERYYEKGYRVGRGFCSPLARVKALNGLHRLALARGDKARAKLFADAAICMRGSRKPRTAK
jgi:hypothetical protein